MIRKQRLLTPGPTPLYPKALYAMLGAEIHHRTEDFRQIYKTLLSDLKEVMGTRHDVLVLVCSGTGAMEASVTNCFSPGDRVIVCSAGRFGERWTEIARAYGLNVTILEEPYGKAVAPEAVEKALAANPDTKGVLVQATESSTGVAHDVRSMGLAVKETGALFIVDAITGLGTMPLSIDDWGLDIVIGGSQKSFMAPPGIAFLSISEKAWAAMETAALPRYYFNLKRERKMAAIGESSWTPAIALLLAFAEALKYIKTLGMARLVDNAQQLARAMRAACAAMGLELFAAENPGAAVTAIKAPDGMDSGVIVKEFRNRFGSVIANGPGALKGRIFRIGHLGYFDFPDLFAIVAELELILQAQGFPVNLGDGVNAVQQIYSELAIRNKETARA
ncbi:MAG TPA: alanine--glyoxylate aminotransferase family protein [Bryobacteraceae bacterium]|jgi:aspartate aminotransferase-like enzyme|nr:alanine--glyoxylate aminotransferase family protein [Bryobacteraceae bacterium]